LGDYRKGATHFLGPCLHVFDAVTVARLSRVKTEAIFGHLARLLPAGTYSIERGLLAAPNLAIRGWLLEAYQFDRYRSRPAPSAVLAVACSLQPVDNCNLGAAGNCNTGTLCNCQIGGAGAGACNGSGICIRTANGQACSL